MIALPVGVAPWAAQLASLPLELALVLAPWVGRLSLAVGPMAEVHRRRTGAPDGYRGLARRGSYERLVAAEWALADELPDEFLRRATAGEHLFLELARDEPRSAQRSLAIVSAGPAQLGSPRLAHLAALVVLARRAARAGAAFHWGVLEDPEHRVFDTLDEAAVRAWLRARTAAAARPAALAAWLDVLGIAGGDDVWFIGGVEDAATARRADARTLVVHDVLEPGARALEVEVQRRGASSRIRLELPAPDDCARLLRDPFRDGDRGPRPATGAGVATEVRFAPGGHRLLVQLYHGVVESWPIPSSPRDQPGKRPRWEVPRDRTLVALGVASRRSILGATVARDDPSVLELSKSTTRQRVRVTVPDHVASRLAASSLPVGTCGLMRLREHARADLVIEVDRHLLVVSDFGSWPAPGVQVAAAALDPHASGGATARQALATAFHRSSVVWAEPHGDTGIRVVATTPRGNRTLATLATNWEGPVFFGFSHPARTSSWGVVAAPCELGWNVAAAALHPTGLPASETVVGVALLGGTPRLLTLPQPQRLAWLVGDRHKLLPPASAPIVAVAVSESRPHIAWVTEAGEVVLYSVADDTVVLRRTPGESA